MVKPTPFVDATRRDLASAGRVRLKLLLPIAAVSVLAATVLSLSPATQWSPLARLLHRDRLPYPGKARELWDSNLESEMSYWKNEIRRRDSKAWRTEFAARLDPEAPLQDVIAEHIDRTVRVNRILDVGAGPLTSINKKCEFCEISITAIDPLADFYNDILARREITPPVRTELGWGERLTEQFGENQFDITYSRNAIDHSYDPIKCIDEMIKVTKKNRYVIAEVNERGGSLEQWTGLHQWDFFVARTLPLLERHLFVEGKSIEAVDVTRQFAKVAKMTTLEVTDGPERSITFVLQKRAD
jgi:SAM-dependent methyltransferase